MSTGHDMALLEAHLKQALQQLARMKKQQQPAKTKSGLSPEKVARITAKRRARIGKKNV